MFLKKRYHILIISLVVITGFLACKKNWNEHDQIVDPALKNNLLQAIKASPNLTKFTDLLIKSGFDKIISSSKTYTVWAPTDQALQSLDPSIVSDSVRLKQFVANHISNQSYLVGSYPATRIKMLNGKFNTLAGNKFDSANITTPNQYSNNGVYHIIDKFIPRIDNIWEFINNNTTAAPLMRNFLLSLNRNVFDPAHATQTGVDPLTGLPVYDTTSGIVVRNGFLDSAANVADETTQYTMILLTDNAYNTEFNKLKPWFKTSSIDSTTRLTGFWLVKDLVVKGLYTPDQLPDTLLSRDSVKIPMNRSSIIATYKTSNGIVYIMNQVNFNLTYKFPPIIIEGEFPNAFSADRSINTYYRIRNNPVTGLNFEDILMTNYNIANYNILYRRLVNSMRYNAYWVAVNDLQTTPLWQQRLGIDSINNLTNLPYVTVAYKNYNEVSLGQITINNYRNLNMYVIGPPVASNGGNIDAIVLDYIKLVPAF